MIRGFEDRRELLTDWQDREHTLLVALAVEVGEDRSIPVMLDIACEYCVISEENATKAGWSYS